MEGFCSSKQPQWISLVRCMNDWGHNKHADGELTASSIWMSLKTARVVIVNGYRRVIEAHERNGFNGA